MKHNYIITIILAAGIAAGCVETKKVNPDTYQAPLYVQSSDPKIVFDKEGGKALITIATNAESWSYATRSYRPHCHRYRELLCSQHKQSVQVPR